MVVYIDHSGEEVEGFAPGMEYRAIAKKITGEELVRHYIYRANGRLVDPKQLNPRQLKNLNKQLVPVSEFVYELYLRYIHGTTKTPISSIERLI